MIIYYTILYSPKLYSTLLYYAVYNLFSVLPRFLHHPEPLVRQCAASAELQKWSSKGHTEAFEDPQALVAIAELELGLSEPLAAAAARSLARTLSAPGGGGAPGAHPDAWQRGGAGRGHGAGGEAGADAGRHAAGARAMVGDLEVYGYYVDVIYV